MPDDAELLLQYAESHAEAAFAEFVRKNVDLVYAAAFRQSGRDIQLAEDVTQVVFASVARKAGMLARHPVITAWLYRATRFATIDAVRARQRRQAREHEALDMSRSDAQPAAAIDWNQISPELDRIIASLGERDRCALVLRFFAGKSFTEIGKQLKLSEGAARMRVERSLEKLRIRLSGKGVTSSCAALAVMLAEQGVMAAPAGLGATSAAAALSVPAGGMAVGILAALKFMTTTKIFAASIATVVTLASIVAAVREHTIAQADEQALVEASRQREQLSHEAALSNAHVEKLQRQLTQSVKAQAGAAAVHARPANPMVAMIAMLSNPHIQKMTSILTKIRLDSQYGALFKSLNLPPQQLDQFKGLLVEKEMVAFDTISAAEAEGIDPRTDPQGFFQAVNAAEKTVDADITNLLGPDGFNQFQQFQQSIPARNTSNQVQQALSYTSAPLTNEQANRLVQILQNGPQPLNPNNPFAAINADLGVTTLSSQTLAQAQSLLSPQQLQVLKTQVQQQQLLLARRQSGP